MLEANTAGTYVSESDDNHDGWFLEEMDADEEFRSIYLCNTILQHIYKRKPGAKFIYQSQYSQPDQDKQTHYIPSTSC